MALHQQDVFVLVQEHRLFDADLPEAQTWLEANGWQGVFIPAVEGPGGGASSGCAVLARSWCGLAVPPGGALIEAGRAMCCLAQLPGAEPFLLYAVYFIDGVGVRGQNLEIAASLAQHVVDAALEVVNGSWG